MSIPDLSGSYGESIKFIYHESELRPEAPSVFEEVHVLRNDSRNQTVIIVAENHSEFPGLVDEERFRVPAPLSQQNPISKLYARIFNWLQTAGSPSKFLGLIEREATDRFLYGGGNRFLMETTGKVHSLEVGYWAQVELMKRFREAGRSAQLIRADLRKVGEETWDDALVKFAFAYQDLTASCLIAPSSLQDALTEAKEILMKDRPVYTEIDDVTLEFVKEISQFFGRPFLSTWRSARTLGELVEGHQGLQQVLSAIRTLFPKVESEIQTIFEKPCVEAEDIGLVQVVASVTARVMDLNVLRWILAAPRDCCIVVQAGAAHSSFVSLILQLLYGFQLEALYLPVEAKTVKPPKDHSEFEMELELIEAADARVLVSEMLDRARGFLYNPTHLSNILQIMVLEKSFGDSVKGIESYLEVVRKASKSRKI